MSEILNVSSRSKQSKGANKQMRREGYIPAVIYGKNKENKVISVDHKTILRALQHGERIFTLKVDNNEELEVITKGVQHHPLKIDTLTHIDFMTISQGTEITDKILISIVNEDSNAGIKQGGTLSRLMNEIEVKFLPKNMPSTIEIDISNLQMGASLHLADIELPENVSMVTEISEDNNHPVVSILKPKIIDEEDRTEDKTAEPNENSSEKSAGQ